MKVEDNSTERKKYHHFGDMLFNLTGLEHVNSYVTAPGACRGSLVVLLIQMKGENSLSQVLSLPAFFI